MDWQDGVKMDGRRHETAILRSHFWNQFGTTYFEYSTRRLYCLPSLGHVWERHLRQRFREVTFGTNLGPRTSSIQLEDFTAYPVWDTSGDEDEDKDESEDEDEDENEIEDEDEVKASVDPIRNRARTGRGRKLWMWMW